MLWPAKEWIGIRLTAMILAATLGGSVLAQPQGEGPPAGGAPETPPVETTPGETMRPVPATLNSPAATIETFIIAMSDDDMETALTCLDLSTIESVVAPDRATQLYRCFNRLEFVSFDAGSTLATVRADRIGDATSWTFFPRDVNVRRSTWATRERFKDIRAIAPDAEITLVRQPAGDWVFSSATVSGARAFWDKLKAANVEPVEGIDAAETQLLWERIEDRVPTYFVVNEFLTVSYWQWIAISLIVIVGVVLDYTTRFVLASISRRAIEKRRARARPETLRKTMRPFGLIAAAVLWIYAIRFLGLRDESVTVVIAAVRFFMMLALVWSAYRVTDLLAEVAASKATATSSRFDDLLVPLVRKAVKLAITVLAIVFLADKLDLSIGPLLTGIGIGGVGFAFAAKDTVEHLFGSVTVIADRPFDVGDWVKIGDVEGTVEELGFRSTRVRTFYNSLVTVPNGNLVRASVDNYGRRKYRRWSTHLGITYDTPPDVCEAFCEGIREIVRCHPYTRKDYFQIWLHGFGASSLDVLLYVFFETPDWTTELRERQRLMLDIMRLAERLGVSFAFPTQTLHVHQDASDGDQPPPEPPARSADRRARAVGRRAVRAITADAAWRDKVPPPYSFSSLDEDDDEDTQIESKVGGDA